MRVQLLFLSALLVLVTSTARAELPGPPTELSPWSMAWSPDDPGVLAADGLLEKPAGKNGPIVIKNGHFYTSDQRIRFWGVNIAFGGNFPPHEEADALARRLSRFGINAVRLHHMDSQPFPNGIFSDAAGEHLSDEALDRLDYFVAALKKEGVYSDLNLHVSRRWTSTHHWPDVDKLSDPLDKIIDVFHPDLIAANKQYARDLLSHVNHYTGKNYATEPAICIVEINNEDTMFLWGGEQKLASLPEPYSTLLQKLWNQWLTAKYGSRDKLKPAWSVGEVPLGEQLLQDPSFEKLKADKSPWFMEQHAAAKASVVAEPDQKPSPGVKLTITSVTDTPWHLQFKQAGMSIKAGQFYTVRFSVQADQPRVIDIGCNQAHAPWKNLGLGAAVRAGTEPQQFHYGFVASADDANASFSFGVGQQTGTVDLSGIELREGGREGLHDDEDPASGTVRSHDPAIATTAQRADDWFEFVQQTDQKYWVEMYRFLKEDLGVKQPVTGTIGLGALGTLSQTKMDFVDAHAYWDHPNFPHRMWDGRDWLIKNAPMVDTPAGAALWSLSATHVAGKPFTVTEYNHAAPNDWQAECVPMITSYAAMQDWDAVFLFAYSHSHQYQKEKTSSYFDIEGNPTKMPFMPLAARMFLGANGQPGIAPITSRRLVTPQHEQLLATASRYYYTQWPFVESLGVNWSDALTHQLLISFDGQSPGATEGAPDPRVKWTADGAGSGQFIVNDRHGLVFVGFTKPGQPIHLGPVRIDQVTTPFVSLMLTPADPRQTIASADRLLLALVGRSENTDMKWLPNRRSVSDHWGKAPPLIETVNATIHLSDTLPHTIYALTSEGKRGNKLESITSDGDVTVKLGAEKTLWYELTK